MDSIRRRNLLGGFFGGMAGILSSWYIIPAALPFGVLIGVIVGYWHSEMLQAIRGRAQLKESNFVLLLVQVFALPPTAASLLQVDILAPAKEFRAHLAEHPMNVAWYVTGTISACLVTPIAFVSGDLGSFIL